MKHAADGIDPYRLRLGAVAVTTMAFSWPLVLISTYCSQAQRS